MEYLYVALGGAVGSTIRYCLSSIKLKTEFPIMTFLINFIGSFLIGLIVAFAIKYQLSEKVVLFLKVGLCGGFTTFSTFSLETFSLIENKSYGIAIMYATLSLIVCIVGVALGKNLLK